MPWSGSGTFSRIMSWAADKAANINITASRMDTDSNDFTTGINTCLAKDGQNSPSANLPMASFKHTGVSTSSGSSSRSEYAATAVVQDGAVVYTAASGTDTYTANLSPAISAYVDGAEYNVEIANPNATTTPTLALNGMAAKTIVRPDNAALVAGDLNGAHHFRRDAANDVIRVLNPKKINGADITAASMTVALNENQGSDIASASTTNIGAATGNYVKITGTTTITAFDTIAKGARRILEFAGALTLTHNATSLILPGAANITTAAGDIAVFVSEGSGNWRCVSYSAASSPPAYWTTGDVKTTLKTAADSGWVMMNDGTIGDASSSGTTRANADTSALFTLLWNNTADADCPVSMGRGASAAADFAAHKTIALPKILGRALASAGAGSGLTSRALAHVLGEETHTMAIGELVPHTHAIHADDSTTNAGLNIRSGQNNDETINTQSTGSGTPFNVMQPTTFLNFMIKL